MDRVFFEEKQKLPQFVPWIAGIIGLGSCSPLFWGIYVRTALHEPWGDVSMSNLELYLLFAFLLSMAGLMFWMISNVSLEVTIDQAGIWYRSFPHHWKRQRVEKTSISAYVVRKLQWNEMLQRRTKGIRRPNANEKFLITGNMALVLTLEGGKTLTLGTRDSESVNWAMGKLMSNS